MTERTIRNEPVLSETMPVLVVGAETAAGRAAIRALARGGGEVRGYADATATDEAAAADLRAFGIKVAVGDLDDEAHLEAALEQVHTIVHLAGDAFEDPDEQLDALATTVSAALGAGCRRIVWATELAAVKPAGNAYLEALATGEDMLAAAPVETVVLRCGLRYALDDAFSRRLAATDLGDADRAAPHAPLHLEDLADAVRAADRQRGGNPDVHLVVELVGPDEVTLGDFHRRLRAALGDPSVEGSLPDRLQRWLSAPADGGPDALGRSGRSLHEGLTP